MKKAFVMIELLISVLLIAILLTVMVVLVINLNSSNQNRTETIQKVISSSEAEEFDSVVTLNNGLQLGTVSRNGYLVEYIR